MGVCVSCKDGFYGILCGNFCLWNCKDNKCNIKMGECLECEGECFGKNCICMGFCYEDKCIVDGRLVFMFLKYVKIIFFIVVV